MLYLINVQICKISFSSFFLFFFFFFNLQNVAKCVAKFTNFAQVPKPRRIPSPGDPWGSMRTQKPRINRAGPGVLENTKISRERMGGRKRSPARFMVTALGCLPHKTATDILKRSPNTWPAPPDNCQVHLQCWTHCRIFSHYISLNLISLEKNLTSSNSHYQQHASLQQQTLRQLHGYPRPRVSTWLSKSPSLTAEGIHVTT